jgi:hypothetical protein
MDLGLGRAECTTCLTDVSGGDQGHRFPRSHLSVDRFNPDIYVNKHEGDNLEFLGYLYIDINVYNNLHSVTPCKTSQGPNPTSARRRNLKNINSRTRRPILRFQIRRHSKIVVSICIQLRIRWLRFSQISERRISVR